ncbi:hypothetical protein ACFFWE_31480 [Sphaerisporangium melleum]|uniref:hypothetical protein n=1 Tax=Sphaerisporangium melleum TaxID=321316 RepID=UPI0035E487FC
MVVAPLALLAVAVVIVGAVAKSCSISLDAALNDTDREIQAANLSLACRSVAISGRKSRSGDECSRKSRSGVLAIQLKGLSNPVTLERPYGNHDYRAECKFL